MKILKYIFLFGVLCVNSAALAQKITKVVDKEVSFIAITAESKTAEYENINLILEGKSASKFSKALREEMKSFSNWFNTAKENNLTDFEKRLRNKYKIDHLLFDLNGHSYYTKAMYVDPKFVINKAGEFFLRIEGTYQGGIGTDYYSTSQGLSFDGRQASVNSGVSSLMKKVSFEYDINLPVDTIIPWLQDLDNKGHKLIEEKKELKRAEKKKQKLFK